LQEASFDPEFYKQYFKTIAAAMLPALEKQPV